MTPEKLLEKLSQGENEIFELKTDIRDPMMLSKLIGAFSNNLGGQIFIGLKNQLK